MSWKFSSSQIKYFQISLIILWIKLHAPYGLILMFTLSPLYQYIFSGNKQLFFHLIIFPYFKNAKRLSGVVTYDILTL